jgi:O-antigen/teichoic acid export membrane protein
MAHKHQSEIQSSLYLFLEYFIKFAAAAVTNITIVRTLGPELNGKFNYILSYSYTLMPLYMMGISEFMIRDLKDQNGHDYSQNEVMGTAFVLKLIGGLAATLLIFVAAMITETVFSTQILITFIAFFLIFKSFEVIESWYLYKVSTKRISLIRMISNILFSVIKVVLCWLDFSWEIILSVAIFESIFYAAAHLIV